MIGCVCGGVGEVAVVGIVGGMMFMLRRFLKIWTRRKHA